MRVARPGSRLASRLIVSIPLAVLLLCWLSTLALAQLTTANLRGSVRSADDQVPMAGVEVTLTNETNGVTQTTTTNDSGEFVFAQLQIGGPYHVIANLAGFKSSEEKGIFLQANRTRDVALELHLQEEVIEVSSAPVARNTSNRTVVTAAEIQALPSVNRDPRDVVRRNPEVTVEGPQKTLSIGGANNRYNSITIDGIRQDDDFGLNASGYPTLRSPISLSVIQELTVETSPFDVHYNKFLGGNVNIVTKSGSNDFHGEVFGTYAGSALLGSQSGDRKLNLDYKEYRYGATLTGPIVKDNVFFVASVEGFRSRTPIDNGPRGSGAANITTQVTQDQLDQARIISRDVYHFDAGRPSQSGKETDLKLFGKVDWFINSQNHAVFEYQRSDGNQIQLGNAQTQNLLPLSSNWFNSNQTLNTFAGRVFSNWTDKLSTEVEANAKIVKNRVPPLNGDDFTQARILIGNTTDTGGQGVIALGPDASRQSNSLSTDVYHGRAEANYLEGTNLITGGVEYEFTKVNNLFLQNTNGTATYNSLADFAAKNPQQIVYQNSTTLDPQDAAANWGYGVFSGYLQDQVKLTPDLTVQGGLRYERYETGDHPVRNQTFANRYGFANNATLDGRDLLEPRLGVSWLPTNNLNIRAGGGLFSGGTPGVWASNNYTNDGVRTFSSTFTKQNTPAILGFDGFHIPQALKDAIANGKNAGNVDSLDPNFKLPSVWKLGTGADYSLDIPGTGDYGRNIEFKLNYTFTKAYHAVTWIDLRRDLNNPLYGGANNLPIGHTPDGRPLYSPNFNTRRGVDIQLTNDDRGYGNVASLQVQKGFPFGLYVSGSYAYTNTQEVNPGTSSVSTSNYGIVAVTDPNHPSLAVSNYERRHRFTGALEYSHSIIGEFTNQRPWKDMKTSFGLFAESRSGQPFSWTFGGGDNTGQNLSRIFGEDSAIANRNRELFFVPLDSRTCEADGPNCDVVLKGITKKQFNTFLQRTGLDQYRGKIAPRNGFKSPRFNKVDVRIAQDLPNPIPGHRAQFIIDIENVGNLLDHNWGVARQTPFPYYTQAVDVAVNRTNNSYVYSGLRSANPTVLDVLSSVWKISLGVTYDF
ncbi:MAG TPA: TonB-dependent receptor [Kofleriaceae bacterium]|nr:TonB-dependent receptor [Kofleriaceae bacterium]